MSDTAHAPVLLTSIGQKLAQLAQHAGAHGHEEERGAAGESDDKEDAPDCIVDHILEISEALFSLVDPKHHKTMLMLRRDLPEGLVEQLQQVAQQEAEKARRN